MKAEHFPMDPGLGFQAIDILLRCNRRPLCNAG